MKTNGVCVAVAAIIASMQPGVAQISLDMNQITCRDFLSYTPENQELVRFWLSGYYNAAANSNVLNYDQMQKNSAKVLAHCKAHGNDSLPTAIQKTAS